MFKSKSKGFTMVELLATVTILGILATIATVSVTRTMQKAHKEYDQKQNKLFTTAAQTYFTDNRSELPKKLLTTKTVTLQELIDKNYIEEIVDYKKKAYDKENSKAYVKKTGAGKYIYYSILVSGDGKRTESDAPDTNNSNQNIQISIDIPDVKNTDMKSSFEESDNIVVYYVNKEITIPIELSSKEGISSYQYKINKLSSITDTGKKYKTSGEIAIDNTSFSDTISINAKDFANGIYQLEIDAYGYQAEVSKKTAPAPYIIVIDKTKPKCTISVDGTPGNFDKDIGATWYKKGDLIANLDITETNQHQYAVGLNGNDTNLRYEENKNKIESPKFTENIIGKKIYGYVIDKAGNKGNCETEKPIYYDNTIPTCEITAKEPDGNNGWYLSDISLSLKRYDDNRQNQSEQGDNESGITAYGLSNNSTSNYNSNRSDTIDVEGANIIRYGYVKDKAGNEGKCEKTFKLEKTDPKCSVSIEGTKGENNWYTSTVQFKGSCNKSQSECNGTSNSGEILQIGTNINADIPNIKDEAGREAICNSPIVNIDRDDPEVQFYKSGPTIKGTASDSISGIESYYYGTNADSCGGKTDKISNDSLTLTDTHYNGKTYYLCVKNKAGLITRKSLTAYSACNRTSTKSTTNSSSFTDDDNEDFDDIYNYKYDSNSTKCDNKDTTPTRYYKMTRYGCNCTYDYYWKHSNGKYKYYCSSSVGENTSYRNHSSPDRQLSGNSCPDKTKCYKIAIEYNDTDQGRKACAADGYKIFSNVNVVCLFGSASKNGTGFHGWKWFSNSPDDEYSTQSFNSKGDSTWYHSGGHYYDVSDKKEDACKKACMYGSNACVYDDKKDCKNLQGETIN